MSQVAILALETGDIFYGIGIGISGSTVGEVVFNTSMTGYQEILTDPSYAGQLITLTYPHIGNTGIITSDNESDAIYAKGLIVREATNDYSNWQAQQSLSEFLIDQSVVAISDIDTRALTQLLRKKGSLSGCIVSADAIDNATFEQTTLDKAINQAKNFAGLANMDLAKLVSTKKSYTFNQGTYQLETGNYKTSPPKFKVAVYDFGVKKNILRLLVDEGCELSVYPAQTPVAEILSNNYDGVFLSNGPGDPQPCDYAIANIKVLLKNNIPVFGICLGHQLLALASGAKTTKMKFGHHGANHPVQDLKTKQVMITSQNHGFMVDGSSVLDEQLNITHTSLFDDSIQGIELKNKPAFSFQGHPEASPGPHDLLPLFKKFTQLMTQEVKK